MRSKKWNEKKNCWLFRVCAVVQLCSAEPWINNIHILLNIMKMVRKREHIKHTHRYCNDQISNRDWKKKLLGENLTDSARFEIALVLFLCRCACVLACIRPFIHLIFPCGPHRACLKKYFYLTVLSLISHVMMTMVYVCVVTSNFLHKDFNPFSKTHLAAVAAAAAVAVVSFFYFFFISSLLLHDDELCNFILTAMNGLDWLERYDEEIKTSTATWMNKKEQTQQQQQQQQI